MATPQEVPRSPPGLRTADLINVPCALLITTVGIIANVFILVVVYKNKKLQSPCFLLICGECVVWLIMGPANFLISAQKLGITSRDIDRITCYARITFLAVFCCNASALIMCFIACDRVFGLMYPVVYHRLGRRWVYGTLIFTVSYSLAATTGGLLEIRGINERVVCVSIFSPMSLPFISYYALFNITLGSICVLEYGAVLFTFRYRQKKQQNGALMKQQLAFTPVVKLLMAAYVVTAILPDVVIGIGSMSKQLLDTTLLISPYFGILKISTQLINIFSLLIACKEFRQCAKVLLGIKSGQGKNTVVPVQGNVRVKGGPVAIRH